MVDKFCATMHALWLESGDPGQLQSYCASFISVTSDLGTEFALTELAETPVQTVLPWVRLPEPQMPLVAESDLEDVPEDGFAGVQADTFPVGLTASIAVTGLLHILPNAGNELTSVCETLPGTIDQMKCISRLLSGPSSNQRLRATCFSGPLSRPFQDRVRQYSAKVYEARWGSVAWAAQELLKLEKPLRRFWSLPSYQSAGIEEGRPSTRAGKPGKLIDIQAVDAAIGDQFFWAALLVIDNILAVIRSSIAWAESCRCHWRVLQWDGLAPKLRAQFESCPMRGRRCPEIAAGDLFDVLASMFDVSATAILLELPATLSQAQRAKLLRDFELGRSHFSFSATLKLSAMMEPPRLIFAIAHHEQAKAKAALKQCMRSTCTHAAITRLQEGSLAEEAREFLDGACLGDLPELREHIAIYTFALVCERMVEGDHASIHRAYMKSRHHGESFDSLVRRLGEIKTVMATPDGLDQLSQKLEVCCRSPRLCVQSLGLADHVACAATETSGSWDPISERPSTARTRRPCGGLGQPYLSIDHRRFFQGHQHRRRYHHQGLRQGPQGQQLLWQPLRTGQQLLWQPLRTSTIVVASLLLL